VCKELKSVQKYTLSKKEKDGLTLVCQDCLIKQRKETDFKYRSKKDLPLYGYVKQWELLNNKKLQTDFFNEWDELSIGMDKRNLMKVRSSLMEKYQIRPFVVRLGHQPGQRGERFGHLFCGTPEVSEYLPRDAANNESSPNEKADPDALMMLELEVAQLGETINSVKRENAALKLLVDRLYVLTGHSQNSEGSTRVDNISNGYDPTG
jgi:hypothetical protein